MKKKTPPSLDSFSEDQLAIELARRRATRFDTDVTLAEDALEASSNHDQQLAFQTYLDSHSGRCVGRLEWQPNGNGTKLCQIDRGDPKGATAAKPMKIHGEGGIRTPGIV